jgi:excisionase family DNA binding protein
MNHLKINPENMYTASEVAAILQVSTATVYAWTRSKVLPSYKYGRSYRYLGAGIINPNLAQPVSDWREQMRKFL